MTPVYECWVDDKFCSENRIWKWLHAAGSKTVAWDAKGINCNYPGGEVWLISIGDEQLAALFRLTFASGILSYDIIMP